MLGIWKGWAVANPSSTKTRSPHTRGKINAQPKTRHPRGENNASQGPEHTPISTPGTQSATKGTRGMEMAHKLQAIAPSMVSYKLQAIAPSMVSWSKSHTTNTSWHCVPWRASSLKPPSCGPLTLRTRLGALP
uniref:Uncharacterized protein n=1 Tax=Hemiselmis andersenii TaxID=464988 RepID=A0A7S0XXG9_HEMAN